LIFKEENKENEIFMFPTVIGKDLSNDEKLCVAVLYKTPFINSQ